MKGGQERLGGIIITQPSSEKEAKMLKKKEPLLIVFHFIRHYSRIERAISFQAIDEARIFEKKKKGKRPRYSINPSPSDYLSNPRRNRGSQPTSQLASGSLNFTGVLLNGQLEAREGMNKFPSITTR